MRQVHVLLLSALCGFFLQANIAWAQSYDDLVRQTQSALADYMQTGGRSPVQAAAASPPATQVASAKPVMPALVKPSLPTPSAYRSQPAAALASATPETRDPLISGFKIGDKFRGIRKEFGMIVVSYTFEEDKPLAPAGQGETEYRKLTEVERKTVADVLQNQLPRQVALRFEQASHPKDAYLRVVASDLSKNAGMPGERMLGYASYPNPRGGQLVIDRNLCSPRKPDCELLKGVVRHEIGHTLGLQHPQDAEQKYHRLPSIMQATNLRYNDYQPHDIASLQALYGTAPGGQPLKADSAREIAEADNADKEALQKLPSLASLSALLQQMLQ